MLESSLFLCCSVLGIFCAYFPLFQSPFLTPKLIMLIVTIATGLFLGIKNKRLRLPSNAIMIWFLFGLLLLGLSFIPSNNPYDSLFHVSYYILFFILFFIVLNTSFMTLCSKRYPVFPFSLFISGVVNSGTGIINAIFQLFFSPSNHVIPAVGLVGNSEFYATLLAISFFMGLNHLHKKSLWIKTGLVIILLGLPLSMNKGTLLFLFTYLVVYLVQRKRWWTALIVLSGIITSMVYFLHAFTISLQARLFLWIVSIWMFLNHALLGVGIGQFGHQYTDMVYDLFSRFPFLSSIFGSFATGVENAHQIVFQYGAELGILGILWISAFLLFTLKLIFSKDSPYGIALAFLLYKSSYTVVTTSVTSMALWVILSALAYKHMYRRVVVSKLWIKTVVALFFVLTSVYILVFAYTDFLYLEGRKALALRQYDSATTYFETCTRLSPGHADSYLSLAYISYLNADINEMDNNLYKAQFLYHDEAAILLEADMRFYLKQYANAKPLYEYLHVAFPDRLGPQIKLAVIDLHEGHSLSAQERANDVVNHNPRLYNPAHTTYKAIAKRILLN